MKSVIVVLLFMILQNSNLSSQIIDDDLIGDGDVPTGVSFAYDLAGNRNKREIVFDKTRRKSELTNSDTVSTQNVNPEQYEDYITEEIKLVLSPNPVTEVLKLKISGENDIEVATVCIFDINGNTVKKIDFMQDVLTIDFSDFSNGVYFVQVFIGDNRTQWKIVKI